jgi:hypothetical protein
MITKRKFIEISAATGGLILVGGVPGRAENTPCGFSLSQLQGSGAGGNDKGFTDEYLPAGGCLSKKWRVVGVTVRHGDLVDAVQMIWRDENGNDQPGNMHGGSGGGVSTMRIDAAGGEYIVSMFGKAGDVVDNIGFETNTGQRLGWGGGGGGGFEMRVPGNSCLVGLYGQCGGKVGKVGYLYRPV